MTVIAFHVLGTPVPQGSKRHVGNGVMVEQSNVKAWRQEVKQRAAEAYRDELLDCPIALKIRVRLPRPSSHYGAKGTLRPSAPMMPHRRRGGDVDKIARGICDALTGVVWRDDKLVVSLDVLIAYGDRAQVEIEIRDLARALDEAIERAASPQTNLAFA